MWPDQADVDQAFWSLWRKWSRWQALELAGEGAAAAVALPVAEEEDEVESEVHYRLSTYREAMLEHLLIGELMRRLWPTPLEVCKPQVDAAGYDLILQCRGVLRHVQLKTSFEGAATREVPISVELGRRQGGCVIWTRFDAKTLAPTEFWWFGGGPGAPLPDLSEDRVAKYTRANSQGVKGERSSHRIIPRSSFSRVESVDQLLTAWYTKLAGKQWPTSTWSQRRNMGRVRRRCWAQLVVRRIEAGCFCPGPIATSDMRLSLPSTRMGAHGISVGALAAPRRKCVQEAWSGHLEGGSQKENKRRMENNK